MTKDQLEKIEFGLMELSKLIEIELTNKISNSGDTPERVYLETLVKKLTDIHSKIYYTWEDVWEQCDPLK